MNRVVLRVAFSVSILLALGGCDEIEGVDYLNIGHPADPGSPAGHRAGISRALVSENVDVRPDLGSIGNSQAGSQSSAPVMDHSKMNHSNMSNGGQ